MWKKHFEKHIILSLRARSQKFSLTWLREKCPSSECITTLVPVHNMFHRSFYALQKFNLILYFSQAFCHEIHLLQFWLPFSFSQMESNGLIFPKGQEHLGKIRLISMKVCGYPISMTQHTLSMSLQSSWFFIPPIKMPQHGFSSKWISQPGKCSQPRRLMKYGQ